MQVKDSYFSVHGKGSEEVIFEISDEDASGTTQYFGYLNLEGGWIIQKIDRSVANPTYRYAYGKSLYSTAWTARASQSYGYYNALFTAP